MKGVRGSLLTGRQLDVMRLRARGLTQQQVADELGTTKSNVSALEIAAHRNIERARNTLEMAAMVNARLLVEVSAGTDVNHVPTLLYRKADDNGVRIMVGGPEIIARIMSEVSDHVRGRLVTSPFEVAITKDGELHFFKRH